MHNFQIFLRFLLKMLATYSEVSVLFVRVVEAFHACIEQHEGSKNAQTKSGTRAHETNDVY